MVSVDGAGFAEEAIFVGGGELGAILGRLAIGETEGDRMSWSGEGSVWGSVADICLVWR